MAEAKLTLTAVDQTRQAFESVRRNFSDIERSASSLRAVLGGIGAGLSAGALVGFVRSAIDAADNLGKLSQRVGVTVESLSELEYAGKLADVSTQALGDGLRKLNVNLQEAQAGSKELRAAFQAVGIAQNELGRLGADEALARIADAFARAEDGAGKTALAVRLLGRAGSDFIPLLNQGSSGLRSAADEARQFGLVVSSDAARAAETFNDNMTRLGTATQSFAIALGNFALPSLTKFTNELLEGARIFGGFASALYNIGFAIDPFKSLGENLKTTRKELDALQKSLAATPIGDNRTRAVIEGQIDTLQRRLEFLKFQERQRIQSGAQSTLDARDLALRQGERRGQLQVPETPGAGGAAGGVADLERGTRRAAEFMVNVYAQQFDRLRAEAQQVNSDLVAILQQGPDEAARQAQARASGVEALLGQTQTGRLKQLQQQLADLAQAGAQAPAELQAQYEEAFEIINTEIERTKGNLESTADKLETDYTDAFKSLEFAVQGWGRQFTETLASAIETGKLQFKDLVQSVLRDLLRLQIQQSITVPLFNALSGAVGAVNARFSGAGSSTGGGGTFNGLRLPGNASGGPVFAGGATIVGERGPELFVPGLNGTIIPNGRLGGSVMNVTVNVDARSDIASVREAVAASTRLMQAELARSARRG